MKKGKYAAIILTLCIFLLNLTIAMIPASAANGFDTNMTGWKSADNTAWKLDENGYSNGRYEEDAETSNYKHLAVCDQTVDGTKSFIYEVTFKCDGYGAGLCLNTQDRNNFFAIEINEDKKFYFPSVQNGSWATWNSNGSDLTDEQADAEFKTMRFEYDASSQSGKAYLNDVLMAEVSYVNGAALGKLGLYYEDAEVTFTKAAYTEKEQGGEIQEGIFETNMGEWTAVDGFEWKKTAQGYGCVSNYSNKHVAASSIEIDTAKSFEYEVTFKYDGYGAGIAFGAESAENLAAVEINTEGKCYFPIIIDGAWNTFYEYGKELSDEQRDKTKLHTLLFKYDAADECAEVYLDGELMQELFFFDVDVLSGKLGLYNEDTSAYYTKAVYREVEMPTPTSAPEQTATPSPSETSGTAANTAEATMKPSAKPTESSDTKDDEKSGASPVLIIIVAVLAVAVIAVGVMILIKSKKAGKK